MLTFVVAIWTNNNDDFTTCISMCPSEFPDQLGRHILDSRSQSATLLHFQFGQIIFSVWTNTIFNLEKCYFQFGQILFSIWTNTTFNLDKFTLSHLGQLQSNSGAYVSRLLLKIIQILTFVLFDYKTFAKRRLPIKSSLKENCVFF